MDFIKIIRSGKGKVYVLDSFDIGVSQSEFPSRKKYETHCIEQMVHSIIGPYKVLHTNKGAPYIQEMDSIDISISHSSNFMSLYCSNDGKVGMDIQVKNKDLQPQKDFFLNNAELQQDWNNNELYLIWGAKEALYKEAMGEMVDVNQSVTIREINDSKIISTVQQEERQCSYYMNEKFALVFT